MLRLKVLNHRIGCRCLSDGPIKVYQDLVRKGKTIEDSHQLQALSHLETMHHEILKYNQAKLNSNKSSIKDSPPPVSNSFMSSWLSSKPKVPEKREVSIPMPKSLYLWGGTGSGKTFMMDLFYNNVPIENKRRVHFNTFMIDVHKRLHQLRGTEESENIMDKLVNEIIKDSYLICFDEFQVTDIADAMILKTLFTGLWNKGAVFVATSNRPPSDLYKNGLKRELFVPFIQVLEDRSIVHSIFESKTDYRVMKSEEQAKNSYFYPLTNENKQSINEQYFQYRQLSLDSYESNPAAQEILNKQDFLPTQSLQLVINGHKVLVPSYVVGRRFAKFSFRDLCNEKLWSEDFIVIGKLFKVIFITDVPIMKITARDEIRRFIICIDSFYEAGVRVVVSAAAAPHLLFPVSEEERKASAYDEIFAFDRTVSRLLEMKSAAYLAAISTTTLHGLNYVENVLSPLLVSNEKVNAVDCAGKLWEYYYIPYRSEDINSNSEAPLISIAVVDVAIKDVLLLMNICNPRLLDSLNSRFSKGGNNSKYSLDDLVASIKAKYGIAIEAIEKSTFISVFTELIS